MSTDVVKSLSIENLLRMREAIKERLTSALVILKEAEEIAEAAKLGSVTKLFYGQGRYQNAPSIFEGVDACMPWIDAGGWEHLMSESGLWSGLDSIARSEWRKGIESSKCPELTLENVEATFEKVFADRQQIFERGVVAMFRGLSWDYKTNSPTRFGERLILTRLLDVWGYGKDRYITGLHHAAQNQIDDLARVMSLLDGKPEDDHRNSVGRKLSEAIREERSGKIGCQPGQWECELFSIRWFKNGNGHLTFKRLDVVEKMNAIVAKHYPGAIATPNTGTSGRRAK